MKTLVCVSGELGRTTLMAMAPSLDIAGILTDRGSSGIIEWANTAKIPVLIGNPRRGRFANELRTLGKVDLLLSINYLFLIDKELISVPQKKAINIHGSLLPRYRGRAPHIWAIINGETEVGITVHEIDEGCDTGDILLQEKVHLGPETTGGDILKTYERLYPGLLLQAVELISSGMAKFRKQDESRASYFGKRTPEDGEVSWHWGQERIRNWVRALTAPYPGAFTFVNGRKVKIWKVTPTNVLTKGEEPGTILSVEDGHLHVTTKETIIKVTAYSIDDDYKIRAGDIFRGVTHEQ